MSSKLDEELRALVMKQRRAGRSQSAIAAWLRKERGVRITQQALSKVIAREAKDVGDRRTVATKATKATPPKARPAAAEDPRATLARLRRSVRRIGKYNGAAMQLRAIELEARIVDRELKIIEGEEAGAGDFVASLEDLFAIAVGDGADDPREWLRYRLTKALDELGRLAREIERVEGALSAAALSAIRATHTALEALNEHLQPKGAAA